MDSLFVLSAELKLQYFVSFVDSSAHPLTIVQSREFLERYAVPVARFGDAGLWRFNPPEAGLDPPNQAWATLGAHDELDPAAHFEGRWSRTLNEPRGGEPGTIAAGAFRGAEADTSDSQGRVEIRFEGRAIRLLYTAAANRCPLSVSFSFKEPVDLDEYSDHTRWQVSSPLYVAPEPGRNLFVAHIAADDRPGVNLRACYFSFDGFVVE
jgi:hypothetical protein